MSRLVVLGNALALFTVRVTRSHSQIQNFEGAMELFGRAKIVAGAVGHREAHKARALTWSLGVLPQKILKNRRSLLYLNAFQGLNLKSHRQSASIPI